MNPWLILFATTSIQTLTALAGISIPTAAPEITRALGLPGSYVGNFISLSYMGAACAALVGGSMVARIGALRISQMGLLFCAAGLLLAASGQVGLMMVAALLIGLGYGPITPASSHMLAKSTPPQARSLIFSIKQTGVPAGFAISGVLTPPLVLHFGWQMALCLTAALCVLVAFLVQPLRAGQDFDRDRTAHINARAVLAALLSVWRNLKLRRIAYVAMVYSGMQMCVAGFLVTYLNADLHWTLIAAGVALTTANLSSVLFRIVWGWVSDKTGQARLLLAGLGLAMAVLFVVAAMFAETWPHALILLVCAGLGASASAWNGVVLAEVAHIAPKESTGAATGGIMFFTFIGVVLYPPLFGWIQRLSHNYRTSFMVGAVLALLMALQLLWKREN